MGKLFKYSLIFLFIAITLALSYFLFLEGFDKGVEIEDRKEPVPKQVPSKELPFGLSNPYDEDDPEAKDMLDNVLHDLGLSYANGKAGFVIEILGRRKHEPKKCPDSGCVTYDFSTAEEFIDRAVVQGKANLWVVISPTTKNQFVDGKQREDGLTYLPDGPISRSAYRKYLTDLVTHITEYGRQKTGNPGWDVVRWNLYNEVVAEYKQTFDKDIEKAADAYANFVIDSSQVLRKLTPKSEIVLAGASTNTYLTGNEEEFYRLVFQKLLSSSLEFEPFDCWESHWFGEFQDYQRNPVGVGVNEFLQFLKSHGYGDKEFLIRAGATYSGRNLDERKQLMNNYQTEHDQAEYLIKKFVYNIANGVKNIPWSTIVEHKVYQDSYNVHFTQTALIYNGIPDGYSRQQTCSPLRWNPCPDPGYGFKKLSYYAYKKLVEVLRESDWNTIQTIQTGKANTYAFKFNQAKSSVIVVWWDWWLDCPRSNVCVDNCISTYKTDFDRTESCINSCSDSCMESNKPTVTLSVGGVDNVIVTEAIPKYGVGAQVGDYDTSFNVYSKSVSSGEISIQLGKNPIYVGIE